MSDNTQRQQPRDVLEHPSGATEQSSPDAFDRIQEELAESEPVPEASFFEGQSMRPFAPDDPLFALLGAFGDPDGPKTNVAGNKHAYLDDSQGDGQR